MKILMISELFLPIVGGLERHVAALSESLLERGHEVRVLTLGWNGLKSFEDFNGLEVTRISGLFQHFPILYGNRNRRFHPPISDPFIVRKISEVIRNFKPEIIHCHGWILFSLVEANKYHKIPLIVTLHDYGLICPTRTMLVSEKALCNEPFGPKCISCGKKNFGLLKSIAAYKTLNIFRKKLSSVNKFVAVSKFVKEVHEEYMRFNNIHVISNFYKPEIQSLQSLTISFPKQFILFVGALTYSKGVYALIDAYQKITTDIKLVLIGLNHSNMGFKNSDKIIVLENQPHNVVMEAWRRCCFGVVPSIWPDPCPTVIFEGMACHKAIIGSDIGGIKDIVINGETGLLVPPGDTGALKDAIRYLIKNTDIRNEMGYKGFKRFKEYFSIEKITSKIEVLYEKCSYDF